MLIPRDLYRVRQPRRRRAARLQSTASASSHAADAEPTERLRDRDDAHASPREREPVRPPHRNAPTPPRGASDDAPRRGTQLARRQPRRARTPSEPLIGRVPDMRPAPGRPRRPAPAGGGENPASGGGWACSRIALSQRPSGRARAALSRAQRIIGHHQIACGTTGPRTEQRVEAGSPAPDEEPVELGAANHPFARPGLRGDVAARL